MTPEEQVEHLTHLLKLAHTVVAWTTQSTLKQKSAGLRHLVEARQAYYRARVDYVASVRSLSPQDAGGCICSRLWTKHRHDQIDPACMYHYAASVQPWNHRIPWNCPTYYDGCNCEGGPYYQRPTEVVTEEA